MQDGGHFFSRDRRDPGNRKEASGRVKETFPITINPANILPFGIGEADDKFSLLGY